MPGGPKRHGSEWQRLVDSPRPDDGEEHRDVETPATHHSGEHHCHCRGKSDPLIGGCRSPALGNSPPTTEAPYGALGRLGDGARSPAGSTAEDSGSAGHSCTSDSLSSQRGGPAGAEEEMHAPRGAAWPLSQRRPMKRLQTARLRVAGLCCENEVSLVKETLEAMEGVAKVAINAIGQRVVVRYDAAVVEVGALVDALNAYHLGCSVQENGSAGEGREPLLGLRLGAYYAGLVGLFAASTACYFAEHAACPRLAVGLLFLFLLYAIPPIMYTALCSIQRGRLDISVLILIAVASTIALRDFFDASLVIFLFGMARLCERLCLALVQRRLSTIHVTQTRYVILAEPDRKGETLSVDDVPIGTLLSIRTGDQIPLDGTVTHGHMSVDESVLTGEAKPVVKGKGDPLYAGTVAQNGYLEMRTTAVAAESTAARIQRLVEEGQAEASHTAVLVDRFAHYYTPSLLLLAGLVLAAKACLGHGADALAEGLHTALLILVLACPCSLVMATPIATVCAVAAAAQAQVVVKTGGLALDRLAALDVVALDKTGTLTEGALRVTDVLLLREFVDDGAAVSDDPHAPCPYVPHGGCPQPASTGCCGGHSPTPASPAAGGCCSGHKAGSHKTSCGSVTRSGMMARRRQEHHQQVMKAVAALEATSSHPLAAALVAYYCSTVSGGCLGTAKYDAAALPTPTDVAVLPGQGLQGTVEGAAVAVGNRQLMEQLGVGGLAEADPRWQPWGMAAKTVVFVAIDGQLELVMALADRLRGEATAAVQRLHLQGLSVVMLTGDTAACAAAVGAAAGVAEVEAGLRPEHKQRWVAERQGRGQAVCMVGDGINDGPALSQADVGVAMGAGGTALATQAADVILLSDRLALLPAVCALARRCRLVVRLNIATAVLLKAGMLLANFCMVLPLWSAIVADVAALGLVLATGLTLLAPIEGFGHCSHHHHHHHDHHHHTAPDRHYDHAAMLAPV